MDGVDAARRSMLIEMLDIDLSWCADALRLSGNINRFVLVQ